MDDIKVGDKLKIYCYKHDGTLEHTSDEAIVLENNDEYLVGGICYCRYPLFDNSADSSQYPIVLDSESNHLLYGNRMRMVLSGN